MKNLEDRDENYVKAQVKKLLKKHKAYYHMPVQTGFGSPSLDFIGCHHGKYFGVETKRPGKKPTPRQDLTMDMIREAGGVCFVVGDDCIFDIGEDGLPSKAVAFTGMEQLEGWLLLGP